MNTLILLSASTLVLFFFLLILFILTFSSDSQSGKPRAVSTELAKIKSQIEFGENITSSHNRRRLSKQ